MSNVIKGIPFSLCAFVFALTGSARLGAQTPSLDRLIRAEDARAVLPSDLAILRAGASAADTSIRRTAIRALGRLERPDLLPDVIPALSDGNVDVRRTAADAVAQAVTQGDSVASARRALLSRIPREKDPEVLGQLAESLGRLRADSGTVQETAATLTAMLPSRGAVRGLFFLTQQRVSRGLVPPATGAALQRVATTLSHPDDVRATAAIARISSGGTTPEDSAAIRRDPSGDVRVTGATASSIDDPAAIVRYRAVALAACPALIHATNDSNSHVAIAAIDALQKCAGDNAAIATLEASSSPHAVVSLAAVAPDRVPVRLARLAVNPDPFIRVYAVRAAIKVRDTVMMRRLAIDSNANVASEAISGLSSITAHTDDAIYTQALRSDASQLLIVAAKALKGSKNPNTTLELTRTLDRVTALKRETSRDARMALIETLGSAVPARYAHDFDPEIAARVAKLTGVAAAPVLLARAPVPTVAQLRSVHGATITMASGDRVELELLPFDAPTNSWRFVRLARSGYFNGLTFHRIVPFFVVQGGSPLANEYVGDAAFSRDEFGLENRRGTVGISTRGRDTGDGQIYFNTVDNVRLDHGFTIIARVTSGMDVVDWMQEGARIATITVH
jgi:peptidyl-prolyl cis-trans isomerase B (cyclophilin B)